MSKANKERVGPELPWFWSSKSKNGTVAVDTDGRIWLASGLIDLSPFHFEDRSMKLEAVLESYNKLELSGDKK